MSIIKLPMRFEGYKGEKVLYALFDFSTNLSCISEEFAPQIANLEASISLDDSLLHQSIILLR
ncbi:MAG: hypothetical protein IPL98_18225 [Saprospiraceae bacterium]|jgi:hypothetical protein|nr:hypothetical protein [Saprospiraceae bacterium]